MRRNSTVLGASALLVLLAPACGGKSSPMGARPDGKPTPPQVAAVAERLAAPTVRAQRRALSPALAEFLPRRRVLPRGAELHLDDRGWRVSGRYGNAVGAITLPGKGETRVEVGFVKTTRGWRITFVEQLR